MVASRKPANNGVQRTPEAGAADADRFGELVGGRWKSS